MMKRFSEGNFRDGEGVYWVGAVMEWERSRIHVPYVSRDAGALREALERGDEGEVERLRFRTFRAER